MQANQVKALLSTADSIINNNSTPSTIKRQSSKMNNHDSGLDVDSTIQNSETQSFDNLLQNKVLKANQTEKLKNDLDEVEELTTRVRDSISIDLSSTRRYSPLLYEYYRKQLELAKSIQSTYNIQCNSLFDAMSLMRKCLKDYCQSVHNPEYFAIDSFHHNNKQSGIFQTKITTTPLSHLATCYESKSGFPILNNHHLGINKSSSFNSPGIVVNRQLKNILSSNTFNHGNRSDSANNTFLTSSENTSATTSTTSSPSVTSAPSVNQLEPQKLTIENKQTYV